MGVFEGGLVVGIDSAASWEREDKRFGCKLFKISRI
jgi:hypothetical protein